MSKIASRPLDEDNTHRQKWSFLEVARHIKSHGLKGSLRNPLRQRFERGSSKTSESKAPHPSLGTGIHPPQALPSRLEVSQPSIPSPGLTGPKGCSIVTVDNSPQETALKRKVPQSPVELSISHTGRTVSASGATLEQPGLQSNNTNVDNTPGPGVGDTKSSSASFMGSQCGLSGNNGSAEIGTFGGHESRTNTPSKSIIDEVSNQPSEAYQAREPITSSVRSPVVIHEMPPKIPPATSETDLLGNAPISRQMTAAEVVSHLVKHGITDLSETLDYTTFDEHPVVTGGSSDIYRGQLKSGADVAVKVLRFVVQSFSEASENIRDAARELHTWSKCDHPNVLPLRGLVNFRSRIGMVSPWMSEGTMPCYIKANPKANRHNLCIQICEGLSYLHEKGVVHGDLKGANVLVSEDGIPVLTDFGNSTLKDRTLKFTQVGNDSAFTVRWSAPEFIKDSGLSLRTKASDIYALGMTIYEAIVGKIPYYGETELQVIIMVAMKKAPPQRPDWIRSGHESGDKLWDLLTRCWSWEPEARPSVTEVTSIIRTINIEELFV